MNLNRKEFLRTLALAGTAAATGSWNGLKVLAQTSEKKAEDIELVAVLGGEPDVMLQKALEKFGGIRKFVKSGQTVVVKPNIGWARTPEFAANTHPLLIKELIKQCYAAGAKKVTVFDRTCNDMEVCYKLSGIEAAVKEAGGEIVPSDWEEYYAEVELPKGVKLKKTKIHKALLDADIWFNVPVLKAHSGAGLTIALKNYLGIVWDRQAFHRTDLQQTIADVATWEKRPVLNIVDSYRLLKAHGPSSGDISDAVLVKSLFMSPDIVAVDTAALNLFNQVAEKQGFDKKELSRVSHIQHAQDLKLGTTDLKSLKVESIRS
ncbi:MAG: DUF362 domain-containing protein [Planctomycetaceae bacterium]|jgi:uncharacterized protein (DUF362 family)|nr:DUF362 domain-containing protein [Planctomycetaceae bacterium]